MGFAIGIDIGTHQCCVHAVVDGGTVLVPSETGSATIPAFLAVDDGGDFLVGSAAQRQAITNPERSVFGVKRLLGRKYHSPEVGWLLGMSPWPLIPAPNGDVAVELGGTPYHPQELLARLLIHLRKLAAKTLGDRVEAAVISVPASFDARQRRALRDAAQIADLRLLELINEPSAAALAHVHRFPEARDFATIDFGAGCLDVSLLRLGPRGLEVIASAGDTLLGGNDFDRHLVAQMVGEFYDEHGYDLADSPSALQRLWEAARLAKHELSTAHTANRIELPHVTRIGGVPQHLSRAGFEREELDALAREEIERLAGPCRWVLEDSGMASEDIDEVLLVGGASRLPVVSDALDQLFHGRVRTAPQAEQMVAEGAARRAGLLRGELSGPHLHDVATVSLGIKVGEGRFRAIVERNQPIPRVETKRFQPTSGDYHRMVFELYQGEADLATENIYLGRLELRDVSGPVEVSFAVDDSGLLSLTAETADRVSPPPSLSVQWSGGLLDEERDQLRIAASAPPKPARPATPTRVERSVSPAPPNERPGETARPAAPMPAAIPLAPFRVKGKERPTAPTIPGTPIRGDTAHRDGPHRDGHRDGAPGSPPSSRPPQHSRPPSSPRDSLPAPAGPMAVEADSLLGATLGGRYLIEAVVAEGGMGRVYRAKHEVLGRRFAIKVLHAELASNSEIADRFVREAQAASMIDSPHVVDISDFGRLEDGTGFFVMEFLSGKTLADHIEAKGALPLGELLDIGIQLTKGLAAAHALDIIHRDLKPENITLIERGGHRFCKIVDFGIAKSPTSDTNKRLTLAGTLLGTPHYMAPEQIDGEDVDARSDLYALGAVLFEMATGRTVFEADTVVNLLVHHKITPAPRATSLAPQPIPEALDDLIASCLSKSPEERPASAKDVGEQLQAMLERDH